MTDLFFMYLVFGLLQIVLALPLMNEKVKPNHWYGLRVPATLNDPQVWYRANRYTGARLLWAGVVFTVVAVAAYFIPGMSTDTYATICGLVFLACIILVLWTSFRYLAHLKRQQEKDRSIVDK